MKIGQMFNRYWRDYPWMFQLIQFIILILVTASFFLFGLLPLLANLIGVPQTETLNITKNTASNIRQAALLYQFVGATAIFLLPALMFGYFTHPKPWQYLGLRKPGKDIQWFWVVIIMLSAAPVLIEVQSLVGLLPMSESMKAAQEQLNAQINGYLMMPDFGEFLLCFATLAILPAVSEELFFRGVMFRMAAKGTSKPIFAIILTALVFALFHYNFLGFISIFLAGAILGFIYYITGSLWLSILAHLIHNGLQIVLIYFFRDSEAIKSLIADDKLPIYIPLIGLMVFVGAFYMLWKNRTPLAPNWADDFTEEEKQEIMRERSEE